MRQKILSHSSTFTKKLAVRFARKIIKIWPPEKALVIGLSGELGGGKTTFIQGFAGGLGVKEKVLSPTFILMRKFKIRNAKKAGRYFQNLYHFDCYRIARPKELLVLGFKEIIYRPENIAAIEWSEYLRKNMPKNTIWVKFSHRGKNVRKIQFTFPPGITIQAI